MRDHLLLLVALAIPASLSAQQPGRVAQLVHAQQAEYGRMTPVTLFKQEASGPTTDALWKDACRRADVLKYDEALAARLIAEAPARLRIDIPAAGGFVRLDLEHSPILADGFVVRRASDDRAEMPPPALHYRGIIEGDPTSIAAISIFGEEAMGLIADDQGQRILGPFEKAPKGLHVLYRDSDLLGTSDFTCSIVNPPGVDAAPDHPDTDGAERTVRCVHWYWEATYAIYQGKGSVANVTNYLTGLFNQSAVLFANDGVDVSLQEIFVWDEPSPYEGSNSHDLLYDFAAYRTTFNGDMAHLLDYSGYGGVAWLDVLCAPAYYRKAYSGIHSSYSNVPTYSWSVNVVTHEQGHNMGSYHTHDCVWNGDNTAIDGCGPSKGYQSSVGDCPQAELPSGGGTIMSYCHLVSGVGMNFNLGFGPQPKQVIINGVNNASCLASCGSTCEPPGSLFVLNLTVEGAILNWWNVGALSYDVRWREQGSGTWNEVAGVEGLTHPVEDLTPSTDYEFQVRSNCVGGQSDWSYTYSFTTPDVCVDVYEPNDTRQTATPVTLPANLEATIADGDDVDCYSLTLPGYSSLTAVINDLPVAMVLSLLDADGNILAVSGSEGSSAQYLNVYVPEGDYFVQVSGVDGSFHATRCYMLYVNAYPVLCPPPYTPSSSGITWEEATITWDAPVTPVEYDLRWRPTGSPNYSWTVVPGLSGPPYVLFGLQPLTSYEVQVRSRCSGGTGGGPGGGQGGNPISDYSPGHTFITLAAPCGGDPVIRVAAKVLLEGPYRPTNGLMDDALRTGQYLPLDEPYGDMGLEVTGQGSTTSVVLEATGADAIVDWVLLELRDAASGSVVVERRAALLQRDGDVVDVDGTGPVIFCSTAGDYRVAVRHRNHLGCMTASAITLGAAPSTVDFTSAGTATYGTDARKEMGGMLMLWAGNTTGDQVLRYTGSANDRDAVLQSVGGSTPTHTATGYLGADSNLDGTVKYTGSGNDREFILINVGNNTPTNVRQEQLP